MTTCHSPVNYSTLSMQLSAVSDILYFFFFKHPASPAENPNKLFCQQSNGIEKLQENVLLHQTHAQHCRKWWKNSKFSFGTTKFIV